MRTENTPHQEPIPAQIRERGRTLVGLGSLFIGGGLAGLIVSADRGQASPTEIVAEIGFVALGHVLVAAGCKMSNPPTWI